MLLKQLLREHAWWAVHPTGVWLFADAYIKNVFDFFDVGIHPYKQKRKLHCSSLERASDK